LAQAILSASLCCYSLVTPLRPCPTRLTSIMGVVRTAIAALLLVGGHAEEVLNDTSVTTATETTTTWYMACATAVQYFEHELCHVSPCRGICTPYLNVMSTVCENETVVLDGQNVSVRSSADDYLEQCKSPCYRGTFMLNDYGCLQKGKWCKKDATCQGLMENMATEWCRDDSMEMGAGRLRTPAWKFYDGACDRCVIKARKAVEDGCEEGVCKKGCQESAKWMNANCVNTTFTLDDEETSIDVFAQTIINASCETTTTEAPTTTTVTTTSSSTTIMSGSEFLHSSMAFTTVSVVPSVLASVMIIFMHLA